jgi:hypothetical protein
VPHSNLFCAFGRLQGGVPRTFEHARRESRNVQHLEQCSTKSSQLADCLLIHNWLIERNLMMNVSAFERFVTARLSTLPQTVRVCYYMPSLQSLDKWQSLPNFAQTKSDNECCGFAKESSWWLVSFVLCFLVFLVLLRLLGERLFIKSVQRSFCTV